MLPRLFAIEVLSVGFGESIILHYGDPDKPKFVLIDGGRPPTFKKSLAPRLSELRATWFPKESLPLEYVIVSSQLFTRIGGIRELLESLQDSRSSDTQPQVQIKNLWFESFGPGHARNGRAHTRLIAEEIGIPLNEPFVNVVTRPTYGSVSLDLATE
ncbi:MAG: hypothetical protein HC861_03745 [Rhodospirillaceae bacterium]|nr:hypothetical protein [Rhodospirillaceae bacterium]